MSRGLFIVCEGLDGAGKTTTIKEMLKSDSKDNNKFVYSKGLGSDSLIGRIYRRFPSTFMFMLELIYVVFKSIKPSLRNGKIIIQDRYDISILSYAPKAKRGHNQILINIMKNLLVKPDALTYFHVSLEERLKRLSKSRHNKYHNILLMNPQLIIARERRYLDLYNQFAVERIKISTTNKSVKEAARILRNFVLKLKNKSLQPDLNRRPTVFLAWYKTAALTS